MQSIQDQKLAPFLRRTRENGAPLRRSKEKGKRKELTKFQSIQQITQSNNFVFTK